MQDQIEARLKELREQFQAGQGQLQELERQEAYLRETMLRISGAIQVLEELLSKPQVTEKATNGSSAALHVP